MSEKSAVLGFDEKFGQRMHGEASYRPADDKMPWQVDERGSGAGSKGLKDFLQTQTDRQEARNVHLPDDIVGSVEYDGKQWACSFTLKGNSVKVTGDNRDAAIMAAAKYISGITVEKEVRELTDAELNYVGSLAQSNRLIEAIEYFLRCSITNKNLSPRTILSDPKYAETCDRAAWLVWSRANNEYCLNDGEFPAFLEAFAVGKRLTISLLDSAWTSYKQQRQRKEIAATFGESKDPRAIAADLENADDDTIRRTYWATAKARAGRK